MRLSKVNLIKRRGPFTPTRETATPPSLPGKVSVGTFWYVREELSDEEVNTQSLIQHHLIIRLTWRLKARLMARVKQADGYRGDIFYGSAERIWKRVGIS